MSVCVCLYLCMHVRSRKCKYVCVCVFIVRRCICMSASVYVCTYLVCTYIHRILARIEEFFSLPIIMFYFTEGYNNGQMTL